MNLKLIGAICVIVGCGGCGFMIAAQYMSKIRFLQSLIAALEYMECELQYRCTPLPQLCRQAGELNQGKIRRVLIYLSEELEAQISPNVELCMTAAVDRLGEQDSALSDVLLDLGRKLGQFDLHGQLQGMESVRKCSMEKLEVLMKGKDNRLRSYQTLGLCAGAAIAILFV